MNVLGPGNYRGYIAGGGVMESKAGLPQAVFDLVATAEETTPGTWTEVDGVFRAYCSLVKRDGTPNFWWERLQEAGLWECGSFDEFSREYGESEVFEFGVSAGNATPEYPNPRDQISYICREGENQRSLKPLDPVALKELNSKFATLLQPKKKAAAPAAAAKKKPGPKPKAKVSAPPKKAVRDAEWAITSIKLRCDADEDAIRAAVESACEEYDTAAFTDENWDEFVTMVIEEVSAAA